MIKLRTWPKENFGDEDVDHDIKCARALIEAISWYRASLAGDSLKFRKVANACLDCIEERTAQILRTYGIEG